MVDRLRLFLNRPLSEGDRPRLFAIVVAVIAGAALILALLDDTAPSPERVRAPERPEPQEPAAPAVVVVPVSTPAAPSEEANVPASLQASRADIARSKRAARAFLAGYLAFTYGHGDASVIPAAVPELRSQLAASPPRVPVSERRRRPRLELLQSDSVGSEHAQFVALVRDGRRRYAVRLELVNTARGWLVIDVGR
jgi:hypothetical protein